VRLLCEEFVVDWGFVMQIKVLNEGQLRKTTTSSGGIIKV
jgi:hypothetical protein